MAAWSKDQAKVGFPASSVMIVVRRKATTWRRRAIAVAFAVTASMVGWWRVPAVRVRVFRSMRAWVCLSWRALAWAVALAVEYTRIRRRVSTGFFLRGPARSMVSSQTR